MKKPVRYLRVVGEFLLLFLECIGAFLVSYGLVVVVGQGMTTGSLSKLEEVTVYVRSNGVHTDVCLPSETDDCCWTDFVPMADFPNAASFDYFTVGWGDKGFFLDTPEWSDLTASTAFNAAFLPSSTAMHVSYGAEPLVDDRCRKVSISRKDYRRMVHYVKNSFQEQATGVTLIEGRGYGVSDNFYEAKGAYHLFNTCNTWTNEVLKAGGIKTSWFATMPDGIMNHLSE